jgi:hypothetical protein
MSQQSPRLPSGLDASQPQQETDTPRNPSAGAVLWFVWMVGMWAAFFVLLRLDRLDAVWTWVRDLPLLVEVIAWFLFLPWILGTAVWTSGWSEPVRVALVLTFALGWTIVSIPRAKKP